ncbi:MAG: hypothetical protein WC443_08380 [Desulfobaccales bacterium]
MITVTDCGCSEHHSCQLTFNGDQSWMVERLIANLCMDGEGYTYVCESGHTHRLIRGLPKPKSAVIPTGYGDMTRERLIELLA